MKYHAYQAQSDLMAQMHFLANFTAERLNLPPIFKPFGLDKLAAACQVFATAEISHSRPDFGFHEMQIGAGEHAEEVMVTEEAAHVLPFCTLLHFKKERSMDLPRV